MAGSNPGWTLGFNPTPSQWNAQWGVKADYTQLTTEAAARAAADNALQIAAEGAQGDATNAAIAAAAAQATASAAMPSTVAALDALFLQWLETNPAAFGVAYGTWLNSLPTSSNAGSPAIWWNNSGTPTFS